MGFFPDHDKAPERDLPRSTGVFRLWELLSRDFWDFFRAGLLALAGAAPFLVGTAFAVTSHVLLFAPLFGLLGGTLAGPQLCALADTVLRALRDEPGFWWHTYKRAWRRSARASLLPGAVGGVLLGTQVFLLLHAGALGLSMAMGGALIAGILAVLGLSLYLWPLLALMELSFPQLLRNAALLFVAQLPRSAAALAITAVYWGLAVRFFMFALSLLPLTNFWLFAVPALLLIYPGIQENFHVEEQIRAMELEKRRSK